MKIKFNVTHIDSGEEYIYEDTKVLDNKEVVLNPNKTYILHISYPLSTTAKFTLNTGKNGITRGGLVKKICDLYKKIYEIEDNTSDVEPVNIPGMLNRITTDGKFGIWGHHIGDLVLVNATVSKEKITLGVDS